MNTDILSTDQQSLLNWVAVINLSEGSWINWKVDLELLCNKLLIATLSHIPLDAALEITKHPLEVSFLFTTDAEIQKLNNDFREKDKATNVLSFPDTDLSVTNLKQASLFKETLCLGDIALAEETILREAKEQEKQPQDHLTHLIIHGILHLLGYDHIDDTDAEEMENLEVKLLAKLNIKTPY